MRSKTMMAGALAMGLALGLSASASSTGDMPAVKVGTATLTVADLEHQLGRVPLFQLQAMGRSPAEVRLRVAEQAANNALMALAAREDGLDQRPEVQQRIRSVLASSLLSELRQKTAGRGAVSDAEVAAYYEEHKAQYTSEQRIRIWQITVATKAEAEALLKIIATDAEYQKDPAAGWDKLVREHSIDKSTSQRQGDLGFVHPDGKTAHRDVTVPVALVKAANSVKNGEVLPQPLAMGKLWVVLQRRGSHRTPERSLVLETPAIRALLAKQKARKGLENLLAGLRTKHVKERNEALLDGIEISHLGELQARKRPGALPGRKAARGDSRPRGPAGNLR